MGKGRQACKAEVEKHNLTEMNVEEALPYVTKMYVIFLQNDNIVVIFVGYANYTQNRRRPMLLKSAMLLIVHNIVLSVFQKSKGIFIVCNWRFICREELVQRALSMIREEENNVQDGMDIEWDEV